MKSVQHVRKNPRKKNDSAQGQVTSGKPEQYDVNRVIAALTPVWKRFHRAEKRNRLSPALRRIPHTV